jgi:hypothetical protein
MSAVAGETSAVRDTLERVRKRALLVGGILLATCVAAAFLTGMESVWRSYLLAVLFWTGIAIGALAILALQHVTGGGWGLAIRRLLEAASRTLPLLALLFLPLLLGLHAIYEWTHAEAVARDAILQAKAPYLNTPFFILRAALYFAIWMAAAFFLNKWSRQQDEGGRPGLTEKLQRLSSATLLLYVLTVTFMSVDWAMSIEPHWFSTMYGVLFIVKQALAAFALVVASAVLLSAHPPLSRVMTAGILHDLGKLLFAFLMVWAYVTFSQFLIVWSGNLPEEIPWYLKRLKGGWGAFAIALVLFQFALPFLFLLTRTIKRNPRTLSAVALLVVVMQFVDLSWIVLPAFSPETFRYHWTDLALPLGVGAIWLAFFAFQIGRRPLLPERDPHFAEAFGHDAHH